MSCCDVKFMSCFFFQPEDELARSVPSAPRDGRHPSASPHIPFNRLALSDDVPRYGSPAPPSHLNSSASRSHHPYDQRSVAPPLHGRTLSDSGDPERRSGSYYSAYGHPSARQIPVNGGYPYGSQPPVSRHPSLPVPGSVSAANHPLPDPNVTPERPSASHKYECSYCGKGFTRPSSLKVRCP